jgi:acyl-CoA thioesterase I
MAIESDARLRLRRAALQRLPLLLLPSAFVSPVRAEGDVLTVHTFGDSILDCGHYNPHGVHPGGLLVRNDDRLFPDFRERDLSSRGPARLEHRAVDGATLDGLEAQIRGVRPTGASVALLTIGGNDLIRGLAADTGAGLQAFERRLESILVRLPVRPVLIGTVYDPTFGRNEENFLAVDARVARKNHVRMNEILSTMGEKFGRVVDLHRHFLTGDPSWFTRTIEPSLTGASEIRRTFLAALT